MLRIILFFTVLLPQAYGEQVTIIEAWVHGIFPVSNSTKSIQEQLNIEERLFTRHAVFIKGTDSKNNELTFEIPIQYFENTKIPLLYPQKSYDFVLSNGALSSNAIAQLP